jgi:hypothetical protein
VLWKIPANSEEVGDDSNMHRDGPGVVGHGDGVCGEGAQDEGQGRTFLKKINISDTTSTSGPKSQPAAPWRIVKKRGIIPVQSQLEKFIQTYCHTLPILNFSLTENLVRLCLQDRPQSGSIITQPASQPTTYFEL